MTVEMISCSIFTKVWDWAEIELATPRSAVRQVSAARHVNYCATRPGQVLKVELVLEGLIRQIWEWRDAKWSHYLYYDVHHSDTRYREYMAANKPLCICL